MFFEDIVQFFYNDLKENLTESIILNEYDDLDIEDLYQGLHRLYLPQQVVKTLLRINIMYPLYHKSKNISSDVLIVDHIAYFLESSLKNDLSGKDNFLKFDYGSDLNVYLLHAVNNINFILDECVGANSLGIVTLLMSLCLLLNQKLNIKLTVENIRYYIFISMLVCVKQIEDCYNIKLTVWGGAFGLSKRDVCCMEMDFCNSLNFDIFVSEHDVFIMADMFNVKLNPRL
jgi:hypothetical protein